MGLIRKLKNCMTDNFSSHKPYYTKEGYKKVYRPDSDCAGKNGYASEHRYVWESKHGPIPKGWVIHHENRDRSNNRLDNLEAMPKWRHDEIHGYDKHGYPKKK